MKPTNTTSRISNRPDHDPQPRTGSVMGTLLTMVTGTVLLVLGLTFHC